MPEQKQKVQTLDSIVEQMKSLVKEIEYILEKEGLINQNKK